MKFAHFADCHIGGWREEKLKNLGIRIFREAVDICIKENVGFVLISGDLFNTALPSIDILKEVALILRKLKVKNIGVYVVPGSHDFSPSGKTMLDVLESSGLIVNVMKFENGKSKFFQDKTGVKITGILGRKGGLEKTDYLELNREELEREEGFKIFMFHSLLNELKPKEFEKIDGESLFSLPKNFKYYAGGHPHFVFSKFIDNYGLVTYPGPLFPNNFGELEKLGHGGFYIVDDKLNLRFVDLKFHDVSSFLVDVGGKGVLDVEREIESLAFEIENKIITLRIEGVLEKGKPSDINFKKIENLFYDSGAFVVLRNVSKLTSKVFEELKVDGSSIDEIESNVINEHKTDFVDYEKVVEILMKTFDKEKGEGEKVLDFENRLIKEVIEVLKLKEVWNEIK